MEGEAGRARGRRRSRDDATQSDAEARLHALLRRVVDVRRGEVRAMLASALFFFFLLSSYFVLRPIRDAVAAASGVSQLPWLFLGTLARHAALQSAVLVARRAVSRAASHSDLVSVLRRQLSDLLRGAAFRVGGEGSAVDVWMGRAFFVWTTVFALFNTSIFWCLMADAFTQRAGEAAVRLHRRRRLVRLDHRVGGHRGAGAEDRRGERAARVGGRCSSWRL